MNGPDFGSKTTWVAILTTVAVIVLCVVQKRAPSEMEIGSCAGLWSLAFHRQGVVDSNKAVAAAIQDAPPPA